MRIGTEPYGEVRWIGQVLGVDGSRKAEMLNNNYFENGRHTPLMILINGGTLTDESFEKLQGYMNDIKGAAGQHAFIILETEATDARVDFDQPDKPEIEIKRPLRTFCRKTSCFKTPSITTGARCRAHFSSPTFMLDIRRTSTGRRRKRRRRLRRSRYSSRRERALRGRSNNRLLNWYQFQYVEAYFLEPDISNPDDLYKLLTVCNNAGGLTPNKAKQIIYEAYGEVAEDYPEEWGDVPLAYSKTQGSAGTFDLGQLAMSLQGQIEKAAASHDDAVVAVMKEVRRLLVKMDKGE